jgi:hypothetical protein
MKMKLLFIFILSAGICKGQLSDSVTLKFSGQILYDTVLKKDFYNPQFKVYNSNFKFAFSVPVDSFGKFSFEKKINSKTENINVTIKCNKHRTFNEFIYIDSNLRIQYYQKNIQLKEDILCTDKWLLPNIYFEENSINIGKCPYPNIYTKEDEVLNFDSLLILTIVNLKRLIEDRNCKIAIESYSDYYENRTISKVRLDYIYKKLVDVGIPEEKLVRVNHDKDTLEFFRYYDGCFPYSMYESDPLIVDKNYINSFNDNYELERAKQLRRIIIFNWIFE